MSGTSILHSERVNAIRLAWVQTYNENTDNEPILRAAREDMAYLLEQLRSVETTLAHAEAFIEHQDMSYRWAEWCEGRDPEKPLSGVGDA